MSDTVVLHLSLIDGVGPVTALRVLNAVGPQDREMLYSWRQSDFCARVGVSAEMADRLVNGLADRSILDRELNLVRFYGAQWCTFEDSEYSCLLRSIHAPPIILYWFGTLPAPEARVIALVGSRKANGYCARVSQALAEGLVSAGIVIASGGALGADALAHRAALHYSGNTCAIIGSGLLHMYPSANKKIFDQMVANGGSVISPFPLATTALPGNFPARNRIIAGMSHATIVTQAGDRSGARITALYALEQGREVGAVPGDIHDPLSLGCHRLLSEGAALITNSDDVVRLCGWSAEESALVQRQRSILDDVQSDPVIVHCAKPLTFDDLLQTLSCDREWLEERLFVLQMDGKIEQDFSGKWMAC